MCLFQLFMRVFVDFGSRSTYHLQPTEAVLHPYLYTTMVSNHFTFLVVLTDLAALTVFSTISA